MRPVIHHPAVLPDKKTLRRLIELVVVEILHDANDLFDAVLTVIQQGSSSMTRIESKLPREGLIHEPFGAIPRKEISAADQTNAVGPHEIFVRHQKARILSLRLALPPQPKGI